MIAVIIKRLSFNSVIGVLLSKTLKNSVLDNVLIQMHL